MQKNYLYLIKIKKFFENIPREYFVFGFFLFFALSITGKLFSFTVMNHEYYQNLASKQQTSTIKNPDSRGIIYATDGKILASSVDLNDLSIDPSLEGNKQNLSDFLTEVVYQEICYLHTYDECRRSLMSFLGVISLEDFRLNELYLKETIQKRVDQRIASTKIMSVLIFEYLSAEQAFDLERARLPGIYINGSNVSVNPEEIVDEENTALILSEILGKDYDEIVWNIRKRVRRNVPILKKLSITTSEYIKQRISDEREALARGFISQDDSFSQFIILTPEQHRYYPESTLASTILGFLNSNGDGQYGIEGYYNQILKGKTIKTYATKDSAGNPIELLDFDENANINGANITLTIDRNIQKMVEEIIDEDVFEYQANNISVIVMDPQTGYILAMASHPRFDPNSPGGAYELVKVTPSKYPNPAVNLLGARVLAVDNIDGDEYIYDGQRIFLREISREEYGDHSLEKYVFANRQGAGVYKNDIIQDLYEPGSIFKPIVFSAAIDAGEMNRYDRYQDNGFVEIGPYKIRNVESKCLGYNTFQHAMDFSCNVGMIRIAQRIGASIFHKYLELYGFGKKTGITLDGEVFGRLDPYETWSQAQLFTTSFGQGITTTILQMAEVYSVLANGGVYYKPQIVKSIEFPDGRKVINQPEPTHRVIKESTAQTMIEVLTQGVDIGAARGGGVPGYSVAGKTGTAQIAYKGRYETGIGSTLGLFAGFAPSEDPRFVIVVKVERPRSSQWGSNTAAKTFAKITENLFNYYAIPPKK